MSSRILKALDQIERGSLPNVVGIRLEGDSEHRNALLFEGSQSKDQRVDHPAATIAVNLHHGFQHLRMLPRVPRHANQSFDILGEARPTKAESGVEIRWSDAAVIAHSKRHLLDIRAKLVAD